MTFSRRSFLRATLVTASAIPACADDDPARDAADAGAELGPDAADTADRILRVDPDAFPQSLASGDPSPDAVVLWTRVRPDLGDVVPVSLELALDEAFDQPLALDGQVARLLDAEATHDHCVKVRVAGLEAGTTYFYRFVIERDDERLSSRTGRTRTAPAPDADVPARFAFVSCQDYNGRWYNPYRRLLEEDVDFVVHLGDYIYETTGDPSFQDPTDERAVTFTDLEGALELEEDGEVFYAARSLDNYRELYRVFRSDAWLQQVHERFPMVVIWDDHEFADDCHGANATFTNERENEEDVERRKNANQAWWEYMPVELQAGPAWTYDRDAAFPGDLTIYRDVRWGRHLHVVLTDLRQYRADHLVPESAFPGRVVLTEEALQARFGEVPGFAEPYVDVATYADGAYAAVLAQAAPVVGFDPAEATGEVAVRVINGYIEALAEAGQGGTAPIDDVAGLPRGVAYASLGKAGLFSSIGSRYLAVRDPFLALADEQFEASDGASEDMMGAEQEAWFLDTMRGSDATWKVWGNEFCLVSRVVDVTDFSALPPEFKQQFLLSVEDWDGAPNKKDELLNALSDIGNVVAVTGDIHAFFAGTPWARGDRSKRIVEFVTGAISSGSYERLLIQTASADPTLREAGASALALLVEDLLLDTDKATNPHLAHADISRQGFAIVDVDGDALTTTFYAIDESEVRSPIAEDRVFEAFEETRFQVRDGAPTLYREFDGQWRRWDDETLAWVDA